MLAFLRKIARRRRLEREMQEELAFHIQSRADDLARTGLGPAESLRRARIEFGGAEQYKERLRDTRHLGWIEDLGRDIAYACRNFIRSPLFAISAAAAIALGIGVNTAVFSLIYSVLYRPLPVRDPGGIRIVYMSARGDGARTQHGSSWFVSFPELRHLRANSRTADLGGISEAQMTAAFAPTGLHTELVTDNLLTLLGAHPERGRFFHPDETASPGGAPVAVLSYRTWQRYFNGEDVIGRVITLNRTAFTIVGVANREFDGPLVLKADIWIPLTMQAITRAGESLIDDANAGFIEVFARKKPGVADSSLLAEMQVLGEQAVTAHDPRKHATVAIAPGALFNYPELMSHSVPILAVVFAVVSLVLLVACANVANMLIARGFSRCREIAIRLSIGAGRGRLIRQFLTEHLLLGLLGGIGGLALSQIGVRAILATIPLGDHQLDISPDWSIAAWTLVFAIAAGITFGLPSAIGMTRADLNHALRGDALETRGGRRFRLQSILIAAQVAASALLLIVAGLLLRAAGNALHTDPGMATDRVLLVRPNVRDLQFTPAQAEHYLHQLRDRAITLPGVTAAALTGFEPITSSCGGQAGAVQPDGSAKLIQISCPEVGPDFFRAMRIRILQGRAFEPADLLPAAKVAIVDESFARLYLPGNPIGRRIRVGSTPADDREVVGVVTSTRPLLFLQNDYPQVYKPIAGIRYLEAFLVVGYDGPRAPLVQALKAFAPQLDREVSYSIKPIEENISTALSIVRVLAAAVAALGAIALLLACTGVYGVVAFTVGRRRREIGIRLALGARGGAVMGLLLWQSLRPVFLGAFLGTAIAVAGAQLIRAMLYGVSPVDPIGFGSALLTLAAVAAIAAWIPASSTLRIDPAATLRHD